MMIFGHDKTNNRVICLNKEIEIVKNFKFLGVWLSDDLKWSEHIKRRKFCAFNASYALKGLGFDNCSMPIDLKINLVTIYCTSTLLYGLQCCELTDKNLYEIQSTEAQILKRSMGLSKYAKTGPLYSALNITQMQTKIKIIKLNFLLQLLDNNLTKNILHKQMLHLDKLHKNSFLIQITKLLEIDPNNFSTSMVEGFIEAIQSQSEEHQDRQFKSNDSYLIRHCLENRSNINDQVLKNILKPQIEDAG